MRETPGFTHWFELGQALQIPNKKLHAMMDKGNDGDPNVVLNEVYKIWLSFDDKASWKKLSESFMYLDETELSQRVEKYSGLGKI